MAIEKLVVACGHGDGDPGACGCGYSEAEQVRDLGRLMKRLGGERVELVGSPDVVLMDTAKDPYKENRACRGYYALGYDPATTAIVELHRDSADAPSAKGAHVVIRGGIGGPDEYDRELADLVSGIFPGRASSVSERTDLLNPNAAYRLGYNYRLLELGFISNPGDCAIWEAAIGELAEGILGAFGIECDSKGASPDLVAPSEQHSETVVCHSVKEGFGGTYRCRVDALNVREAPGMSSAVVATYRHGETVVLDDEYVVKDGYVWGKYVAYSGLTRYVAVGLNTGKPEASDYLVKV